MESEEVYEVEAETPIDLMNEISRYVDEDVELDYVARNGVIQTEDTAGLEQFGEFLEQYGDGKWPVQQEAEIRHDDEQAVIEGSVVYEVLEHEYGSERAGDSEEVEFRAEIDPSAVETFEDVESELTPAA